MEKMAGDDVVVHIVKVRSPLVALQRTSGDGYVSLNAKFAAELCDLFFEPILTRPASHEGR